MYVDAIRGFKIVEAFFGLPGVFVAVIAAMLFSPQGFHGGDQFVWVIFPANLIIYFVFFYHVVLENAARIANDRRASELMEWTHPGFCEKCRLILLVLVDQNVSPASSRELLHRSFRCHRDPGAPAQSFPNIPAAPPVPQHPLRSHYRPKYRHLRQSASPANSLRTETAPHPQRAYFSASLFGLAQYRLDESPAACRFPSQPTPRFPASPAISQCAQCRSCAVPRAQASPF
jgi:hypothetical protein